MGRRFVNVVRGWRVGWWRGVVIRRMDFRLGVFRGARASGGERMDVRGKERGDGAIVEVEIR